MTEDPNIKYLVYHAQAVKIIRGSDGQWRDSNNTIMALQDKALMQSDPIDRCGVGILSLSTSNPLTSGCSPHDYSYSSLTYQLFHTREQADEYLGSLVQQTATDKWGHVAGDFLGTLFSGLANCFGWLLPGKHWRK